MVLLYMVTWIPSIYPLYVSIYTSTMDPMGNNNNDNNNNDNNNNNDSIHGSYGLLLLLTIKHEFRMVKPDVGIHPVWL